MQFPPRMLFFFKPRDSNIIFLYLTAPSTACRPSFPDSNAVLKSRLCDSLLSPSVRIDEAQGRRDTRCPQPCCLWTDSFGVVRIPHHCFLAVSITEIRLDTRPRQAFPTAFQVHLFYRHRDVTAREARMISYPAVLLECGGFQSGRANITIGLFL